MARARGIKQRHPLGSVRSRSGVSQLTAESGITTSGLPGAKISALPAASAANDTDQFEVNQAGTSRRVTVTQLVAAVAAGNGTVTSTSVVSANGLAGTVATPTTTPAITLSTTVNGMVKGNGTAFSAAVVGADYAAASHSHIAGDLPAYPTTLPPNGAAGGALTGTYPNPTLVGGPLSNYLTTATAGTTYLALAGGTLSGALTGTTAAFTGTVTAPGAQLQMVSTQTGTSATGTTLIPFDGTIPQISEGDQYMTLSVTPKSATSKLVIEVIGHLANSAASAGTLTLALFQDAAANALAVSFASQTSNFTANISLRHIMTAGTTSATTFRVRGGSHNAGTTTFNGGHGSTTSSIVITEVAV